MSGTSPYFQFSKHSTTFECITCLKEHVGEGGEVNVAYCNPLLINLITEMFHFNPWLRISAQDTFKYFDPELVLGKIHPRIILYQGYEFSIRTDIINFICYWGSKINSDLYCIIYTIDLLDTINFDIFDTFQDFNIEIFSIALLGLSIKYQGNEINYKLIPGINLQLIIKYEKIAFKLLDYNMYICTIDSLIYKYIGIIHEIDCDKLLKRVLLLLHYISIRSISYKTLLEHAMKLDDLAKDILDELTSRNYNGYHKLINKYLNTK